MPNMTHRWIRRPVTLTALAALAAAAGCSPAAPDRTADMDALQSRIAKLTERPDSADALLPALAASASRAPGDVAAQVRYATALAGAGRAQEALDVAEAAYKKDNEQVGLGLLVGRLRLRLDQGSAAAAAYQAVLAHEPSNIEALNGLGIAEVLQGSLDAAEATFRRAVGLAPAAAQSRNNLALALSLEHRTDEAIPILAALLREDSASGAIRTNLALAYMVSGDRAKAKDALAPVADGRDIDKTLESYASLARTDAPVAAKLALARPTGTADDRAVVRPVRLQP